MDSIITSVFRFLPAVFVAAVVYTVTLFIYRIYLSPLSTIPGPKLAAATGWYEFYYDCILGGQYMFKLQKMHRQYGPIVRISPWEVHINDPDFFDHLYNITNKLDKDPWYYGLTDQPGSVFSTIDADLHRLRRTTISKYFSSASISKIETLLKNHVGILCRRLEEYRKAKKVVTLSDAFRCLATDVVTDYAVPQTWSLLEEEDFAASHAQFFRSFALISLWNRHFHVLFFLINTIPRFIIALMPGPGLSLFDTMQTQKKQTAMVIKNNGAPISSKTYPVIMNEVFNSDLPKEEKTQARLFDEVSILISAGTETTGNTLTLTTYNLLASPTKLQKLKAELAQLPDTSHGGVISYKALEALPYLGGCINEGLRIGGGVSGRLPRINRTHSTKYKNFIIPPGTPISMSPWDLHHNPDLFAEPYVFKPERWLDRGRNGDFEKYFAPFGRGSRGCVGKNLAMAELQMVIGNIFSRFDMKLYETVEADVSLAHDYFSPFGPADSKGLRVIIG